MDKSSLKKVKQVLTTKITISERMINMGHFSWKDNQDKEVAIKNVGHTPLVIDEILTSCGCTTVEYPKESVLPGKNLVLKVKYKAEHPEHFNKTITVYCNAEDAPLKLRITGNAE